MSDWCGPPGFTTGQGSQTRTSDPKADLPTWDRSDAQSLERGVARSGEPGPLFTGLTLRVADGTLWVRTMR
jgi:hypothetical protein